MASQTIAPKRIAGVVISAGKMMKTVKVRMVKLEWNRKLRKHYPIPYKILVNDPNSSLVEGDVITTTPERHSKHVLHTVTSIIAPFGKPVEERPPLLTQEQREAILNEKHNKKMEKRRHRFTEDFEQQGVAKIMNKSLVDGADGGKESDRTEKSLRQQAEEKFAVMDGSKRLGTRRATKRQEKASEENKRVL